MYQYEELVSSFKNSGRLHTLQNTKINENIFIIIKKDLDGEELKRIKVLKHMIAKDNYVVDDMDLQMFDENMKIEKMMLLLNAIRGQEGEKLGK